MKASNDRFLFESSYLKDLIAEATAAAVRSGINVNQPEFKKSLGITGEMKSSSASQSQLIEAVEQVRSIVGPKAAGPKSPEELNDVMTFVMDKIKQFDPPDMLDPVQTVQLAAYFRAYCALRDTLSDAVPESGELNNRISQNTLYNWLLVKAGYSTCPKCGNGTHAKENYCTFCGARIADVIRG